MLFRSVTAIILFSIFLTFSQAFFALTPVVDSNDSAQRNVQWITEDGLNCGYDPYGAQEGFYNHQINLSRLHRKKAEKNISQIAESSLRVEHIGDVVLIEDNGTIVMPPNKFDLKNSSIIFTPQSNGYLIRRGAIAFNKNFGERIRDFIGNGDQVNRNNGFQQIELQGSPFTFFGSTYDHAFICTNGYITFNSGDTLARPSGASLAAAMPRIAPLWADLDFSRKGTIHYLRLSDAHQITWNASPQTIYSGASTFQALLYDDGRIAFVYKKVKARSAVTGISPGNSENLVHMVDLSNPDSNAIEGAVFESFSKDKRLDEPALTRAFYSTHQDVFDTLYIWTDFEFDNGLGVAHAFNVRNDISGIGIPFFDRGAIYGSQSRLSAILKMGNIADNWPADPQSHAVGLNSAISIVCHEQGHRWLSYIQFEEDRKTKDELLGRDLSHWSFLMDTRTNDNGSFSSLMEGNAWRDMGGGIFMTTESAVNHFTELDQYLMGLRGADSVGTLTYLEIDPTILDLVRERSPISGFSMSAVSRRISLDKIIRHEGPRVPDVTASPKTFKIAFILLVEQGEIPSTAILEKVDRYREAQVRYFSVSTGRRGSLDSSLVDTLR
jgi:hypothetical protein